jgi:hypothetical protein
MESIKTPSDFNPFLERMEKLEDKELLDVLKNGSGYQPESVEAAVTVAVKRELISREEGDTLLGYTLGQIKQHEETIEAEVERKKARGRREMVLGIIIFIVGLGFTVNSSHYIWIGALIAGPVLFIRGLFR